MFLCKMFELCRRLVYLSSFAIWASLIMHLVNLLRRVSVTIPLEAREKSESELKTSSLRQR